MGGGGRQLQLEQRLPHSHRNMPHLQEQLKRRLVNQSTELQLRAEESLAGQGGSPQE